MSDVRRESRGVDADNLGECLRAVRALPIRTVFTRPISFMAALQWHTAMSLVDAMGMGC
jgi:hypothetical protein